MLRREVIHFHGAVLLTSGETRFNEGIQDPRAAPSIVRTKNHTYPWPRSIRVGYRSHQLTSGGIIAPVRICLVQEDRRPGYVGGEGEREGVWLDFLLVVCTTHKFDTESVVVRSRIVKGLGKIFGGPVK